MTPRDTDEMAKNMTTHGWVTLSRLSRLVGDSFMNRNNGQLHDEVGFVSNQYGTFPKIYRIFDRPSPIDCKYDYMCCTQL